MTEGPLPPPPPSRDETPPYQRRPGDTVVRRLRLQPEHVVLTARRIPRRPLSPPLVLSSGLFAIIIIGSILLALPLASVDGVWTAPLVAVFTATSAVTLTGLVLVDTGTYWNGFGQAVILLLVQLGGLGFMTGASLVFAALGRRPGLSERMLVQEAVGAFGMGGAARLARRIALTMFAIEAAAAAVLFTRFAGEHSPAGALWLSVFHAVSAFNNAGFDLNGGFRSLTPYQNDPVVLITIAICIVLGGLSYMTLADFARHRSFLRLDLDSKVVLSMSALLWTVAIGAFLLSEWNNPATLGLLAPETRVMNAVFQAVSVRSAGFNAVDMAGYHEQSLFLMVGLMFIGGASASTAGGIRVNTAGVLLAAAVAAALGRADVRAFRRTVPAALVNRALAIALFPVVAVFVVVYLLTFIESAPFLPLLFEAVSAFGTVGLTTGITPGLTPTGAALLIVLMIFGRLGPLTLAVLLAGRLSAPRLRYAEEQVRVG